MNFKLRLERGGLAGLVAAATLVMAAGGAQAQSVKLRVADSFPIGHFVPEYATKFWMNEVTKNSNKTIEFEYFPAEQLGKAKDMPSHPNADREKLKALAPR